jgi:hypothetical protein
MSDKSRTVDRIKKLLALSTSKNVHEAASAAAAAQRLMFEHKLSGEEIEASKDEGLHELPIGAKGFTSVWKFELVTIVARAFFCEALGLRSGKRRKVRIIGSKEDAEIAVKIFNYLCKEIDRLARRELGVLIVAALEEGKSLRRTVDSFRRGAVAAVSRAFHREQERFVASSSKAMILSDRSRDKIFSYLKSRYRAIHKRPIARPKRVEIDIAYEHGYVTGGEITIPSDRRTPRQDASQPFQDAAQPCQDVSVSQNFQTVVREPQPVPQGSQAVPMATQEDPPTLHEGASSAPPVTETSRAKTND